MSNLVKCLYCDYEQLDVGNGGDPGPWWRTEHIPEGDMDCECDDCGTIFGLTVDWSPNFYSYRKEPRGANE